MAVFSKLYPYFSKSLKSNFYQVRHAGHERVLEMYPSNFSWKKAMDFINLYVCIIGVPTILFITYCNIFIGPSELIDIPEGYEPKEYEYNKKPITRMVAKIMSDPNENYERRLDYLTQESEKIIIRKICKHVLNIMEMKQDYDAYYYAPSTAHYLRNLRRRIILADQKEGPLNAIIKEKDFKDL